ncbi:MAG: hypothetical protein WDZ52_11960 [Pseudohongiellaceae bacterium]
MQTSAVWESKRGETYARHTRFDRPGTGLCRFQSREGSASPWFNTGVSRSTHGRRVRPGELPGIENLEGLSIPPAVGTVSVSYIDYSVTRIEAGDITDLDAFLETPKPDWASVRWINISNTHPYIVNLSRKHFEFHTLTAEDVLHIPQRPRIEFFDDHVFVVLRMLQLLVPREGSE